MILILSPSCPSCSFSSSFPSPPNPFPHPLSHPLPSSTPFFFFFLISLLVSPEHGSSLPRPSVCLLSCRSKLQGFLLSCAGGAMFDHPRGGLLKEGSGVFLRGVVGTLLREPRGGESRQLIPVYGSQVGKSSWLGQCNKTML